MGLSAAAALLLLAGCGEATDPAPGSEAIVYVGTATDPAAPERQLNAGFALAGGQLRFSVCGDEAVGTTWARVEVKDVDGTVIDKVSTGWSLIGEISGETARGTLTQSGRKLEWQAEVVPPDSVAGVYTDTDPCPTEVIVALDEADQPVVRGSYCSADGRAQVIPLTPAGSAWRAGEELWIDVSTGGLFVDQEPGQKVLVERMAPAVD
jgi:hypothetical protein